MNDCKHGVRMPEAIPVFDDPRAITITDDESDPDEQRFVTLGMGATGRLLVVVYTWRGENILSFPRVLPNPVSATSTRQKHERTIRLQQRKAGPGCCAGTRARGKGPHHHQARPRHSGPLSPDGGSIWRRGRVSDAHQRSAPGIPGRQGPEEDRKSTRMNSSYIP